MGKLASLLAATVVVGLMQSPVDAAGRSRGCPCACGGAVMATAAAPVPAPAPAVAQSPAAGATQSFSYEPAPAPAVAAPRMIYTTVRARPAYEPGRADNKARGIYNP